MKRHLLMTVAMMGLFSTTYGAGVDAPNNEDENPTNVVLAPCHSLAAGAASAGAAVHADSPAHREIAFTPNIQSILDGLDDSNVEGIFKMLSEMDEDQLDHFIELVSYLLDGIDGVHKSGVIRSLCRIPKEEREDFIESIKPFIDGFEGEGRSLIINYFENVPNNARADVAEKAMELFDDDMNGCDRAFVIYYLGEMDAEERAEFMEIIPPLIDETYGEKRGLLIGLLAEKPGNERADIAEKAVELFGVGMNGHQRSDVLWYFSSLPAGQREVFFDCIIPLITGTQGEGRSLIVKGFAGAPAAQRVEIAAQALELFGAFMEGIHRATLINLLRQLTAAERGEFITHVNSLIHGIHGEHRLLVIQALFDTPAGSRAAVTAQVIDLLEPIMDGAARAQLIRDTAHAL